jgi:hypothetical protein
MATSPLIEAVVDTSTEVARSTTAILRHATFLRMEGSLGVVDMAGGEVEVRLNGLTPKPGDVVSLLQQGYELLMVGPMSGVPAEIAVQSTEPTDPDLKLWMKV